MSRWEPSLDFGFQPRRTHSKRNRSVENRNPKSRDYAGNNYNEYKKYRAATTREALEQIKQDLGEDALVLETKQIRNGGFLGFGSRMQIEVSAAVTAKTETLSVKNQPKAAQEYNRWINTLHLTEDTPAAPRPTDERKKLLNGLKTHHATMTRDFSQRNSIAPSSGILGTVPRAAFSPIEAV